MCIVRSRIFARPQSSVSHVVVGTTLGRFIVWAVPFQRHAEAAAARASAAPEPLEPVRVAYSPSLPRAETAEMV
jgi:hypothetical protein